MSFEIEHILQSDTERLLQGNVLIAQETIDRDSIESAAKYLIQNREQVEELPIADELAQNAVTGLFEKLTAAGHLSHIEFPGDQEQVHIATLKRLLNAYDVNKPDWEERRNFQEICEELTVYQVYEKIAQGVLPEDTIVLTVSDAPDEKISEQEKVDQGYRMLNSKGMVRSYTFNKDENGDWTRVLEQVSRSNSNNSSTRMWFNQHASSVPLSSTGGLSLQAIGTTDRFPDGVVSFVKELDEVVGGGGKYGEVAGKKLPEYHNLRKESAKREEVLAKFSNLLYEKDKELKSLQKAGRITYEQRLYFFYKELDEVLIPRILLNAPEYARDTYGEVSGRLVERASLYLMQGNEVMAHQVMKAAYVTRNKNASTGCGGSGRAIKEQEGPINSTDIIANAIKDAKEDKEDWVWKEGVCQVQSCSTRPGKTKVGPCSVCEKCQAEFDKGKDPTKNKPVSESKVAKLALYNILQFNKDAKVKGKAKNEQFILAA